MSSEWHDYELIDFGEARKLERFGELIFDRPAVAAVGVRKQRPAEWQKRTSRYDGERVGGGRWEPTIDDRHSATDGVLYCDVPIAVGFKMSVIPRPGGQVGMFPEQFANWKWIAGQVQRAVAGGATPGQRPGLNVLNLFAYTGGSTLAAAAASAGAAVTHVDAAKPAVEGASQNAERSGFSDRPIRWIVEDAMKFCRREVKRGNRYDAVILDPPTYGHGPKGEEWLLKRDLWPLLELCGELTERRPIFALLTSHTPGMGPAELAAYLSDGVFGHCGQPPRAGELALETADGRMLASGTYARWPG